MIAEQQTEKISLNYVDVNGKQIGVCRGTDGKLFVSLASLSAATCQFPSRLPYYVRNCRIKDIAVTRPAENPSRRRFLEEVAPVTELKEFLTSFPRPCDNIDKPAVIEALRELEKLPPEQQGPEFDLTKSQGIAGQNSNSSIINYQIRRKQKNPALKLQKVELFGDVVMATPGKDEVWVSLNDLCNIFGVKACSQNYKLKQLPYAKIRKISYTREGARQSRCRVFINDETLTGWLFSLNPSKVREELRDKIVQYQKQAATILRNYFFGEKKPTSALVELPPEPKFVPAEVDPIISAGEAIVAMRRQQLEDSKRLSQVESQVRDLQSRISEVERNQFDPPIALNPVPVEEEWMTVSSYLQSIGKRFNEWDLIQAGRGMIELMKKKGLEVRILSRAQFELKTYPQSVLAEYFRPLLLTVNKSS